MESLAINKILSYVIKLNNSTSWFLRSNRHDELKSKVLNAENKTSSRGTALMPCMYDVRILGAAVEIGYHFITLKRSS